jgi:mono/diheme cytochrome c family protein
MKGFLLGLILGLCILPAAGFIYFHVGRPPVAVADQPFLLERELVRAPLHERIKKEMPKISPVEASATNLEAGAHIYRQQCASCHGLYGRPSSFAGHMYPDAPQLWAPHSDGVVGVSDDPAGETYWKVANGIRLTGMPSYHKVLSPIQMWQVSLLLANADKPLPAGVLDLLKQPLDLDPVSLAPAKAAEGPAQKITDIQMDSMPPAIPPDQK